MQDHVTCFLSRFKSPRAGVLPDRLTLNSRWSGRVIQDYEVPAARSDLGSLAGCNYMFAVLLVVVGDGCNYYVNHSCKKDLGLVC